MCLIIAFELSCSMKNDIFPICIYIYRDAYTSDCFLVILILSRQQAVGAIPI